ncbi:glucosaminidase domain-containing protein [Ktedonobacter racemifer]|uniref:Mannosyl-glycoprotein endo-beta-N-acetylglucosamidase-like domain-containing protein n=1 Tax=Ktedonobacter racemifer DSM 44963 TaxID=485913 RepID=D6TR94_KTERA|nr:glucosaminidase domain-containing protein [Ktedonobacter racemifer]EFH87793.1 hypothetical protein Krac_9142 [Ktedonobacter racemifer DSM 44963]
MVTNRNTSRSIPEVSRRRKRSYAVLLCSVLLIVMGGTVTLLWQIQQGTATRAAGANVIGPPSLPAAYIDQVFAQNGSRMVGTGQLIENESRLTNIDDAFALGVFSAETSYGMAGVGINCLNPGSISGPGCGSFKSYPSYSAAIIDWFTIIKNNYVLGRGLTTVYAISGPYVGTSGAGTWAAKVVNSMTRYQAQTAPPPPPVTSTPTRESRPFNEGPTGFFPAQSFSQDARHIVPGTEVPGRKNTQLQADGLPVALRNTIVAVCLLLSVAVFALGVMLRRRNSSVSIPEIEVQQAAFAVAPPLATVPQTPLPAEVFAAPSFVREAGAFQMVSLSPSTEELERDASQFVASQGQSIPIAPLFGLSAKSAAPRERNTDEYVPLTGLRPGGGLLSRYRNTEALNSSSDGPSQRQSDPSLISVGSGQQEGF